MEGKVSEEQGKFRNGTGCIDQIFAIKIMIEEYLGKGEKLYAAFMDPRSIIVQFWNILKIYGVGGQLLERIQAFCTEASACVRVDKELSFPIRLNVWCRHGYFIFLWKKLKANVRNLSASMMMNGNSWVLVACLFPDYTYVCRESKTGGWIS